MLLLREASEIASVVWDVGRYEWQDAGWMEARPKTTGESAMSIYESPGIVASRSAGQSPTYRRLAVKLVEYVKQMGTRILELLPIMEHPFSGSWGYQIIANYAPTSRFGTPDDFKYFDRLLPQRRDWRDWWTGCCALPQERARPCVSSMARRFTNTPTRAKASSSTGARCLQLRAQRGEVVPHL